MQDRETLQRYINNFRRHFTRWLRPSIGLSSVAHPSVSSGALLEFTIGPDIPNEDQIKDPAPTVNDALGEIKQSAFGGNLRGFRFGGTNVVVEGNRIIIIKGEGKNEGTHSLLAWNFSTVDSAYWAGSGHWTASAFGRDRPVWQTSSFPLLPTPRGFSTVIS